MTQIRVGTYNIGHFTEGHSCKAGGSEPRKPIYREAIISMGCDVVGIQENNIEYNYRHPEISSYEAIYSMFENYETAERHGYNCNAFLSKFRLSNSENIAFENNYKKRYTFESDIEVDGKVIHLMNTHLEWWDTAMRRKQINELIDRAGAYEYVIVLGDMNPCPRYQGKVSGKNAYIDECKMWIDAGYKPAHPSKLGMLPTYLGSEYGDSKGIPYDNVIVSGNMEITQIGQVIRPYMHDHTPFWADIEF